MIVDHTGRPFDPDELTAAGDAPQTARVAFINREFAMHPGRGLTPHRLARIMEDAERGSLIEQCDLADDMEERDGHIHAELSKRRRAVLSVPMQIVPPLNANADETAATEFVTEILEELDIEDIILSMGDGMNKGFAPLEIEWRKLGKSRMPKLELKPQRWFQLPPMDPYTDELRLRNGTIEGEELVPGGWIMHLHKARPGYVARASLARVLAWPYLFKNYSVRDLAEFLEIYGIPMRVGTYPNGAGPAEKATLLRALVSIGHSAAGIIPEGMKIDFEEVSKGASDPFQAMTDWCERTESKAILGQVLSAEAKSTGMGSGVATLQAEVRDDILQSDARQIARSITNLFYLVAVFNGHSIAPGRGPRCKLEMQDTEDLQTFATAIPSLVGVGMEIPESWAHQRLNIPRAEKGERVLIPASPSTAMLSEDAGAQLHGAAGAQQRSKREDQQHLVDAALAAAGEWNDLMKQRVTELYAMLDETRDLQLFRQRMIELATAEPPAELVEKLQRAGFSAQLLSRLPKG